jgi:uncharacterized protein DUF4129
MSRWWTEQAAIADDLFPGGIPRLSLYLIVAAILFGLGWYYWPNWLPWRWTWRSGKRVKTTRSTPVEVLDLIEAEEAEPDELPNLPAEVFVSLADQYAAQGRYAEAIRERLRAMVRQLIDHGIVDSQPGWTVTELCRIAGQDRHSLAVPLGEAAGIFSDIWYGERPALLAHDLRMRELATAVDAALSLTGAGRR